MDGAVNIDDLWPEPYEVNWPLLESAESEDVFGEASFELLKEAGIIAHLAAGLLPHSSMSRDEAILCGLMLKASKLTKALVAMTAHLGADRQLALVRELIELLAVLAYLLEDPGDGARFSQYVESSLVAEREFLKTIRANVGRRGSELKIEKSMARSIERTASAAGIDDVGKLPGRARIGWPSTEELLKGLGDNLYPAYRSGSGVMHTSWADILRNHLIQQGDGSFDLRFEDTAARPQPLYAASLLISDVTLGFLERMHPEATNRFKPQLIDLHDRLMRVFAHHNTWLDNLDTVD